MTSVVKSPTFKEEIIPVLNIQRLENEGRKEGIFPPHFIELT